MTFCYPATFWGDKFTKLKHSGLSGDFSPGKKVKIEVSNNFLKAPTLIKNVDLWFPYVMMVKKSPTWKRWQGLFWTMWGRKKKVLGGKKKFWETFRKPKLLGSWGSTVANLKLEGIDGREPPGVEPAEGLTDWQQDGGHGGPRAFECELDWSRCSADLGS